MPRAAIDYVAQATRYREPAKGELDVLNHDKVNLYLESTIMQPSYKIGMFFDQPWWSPDAQNPATYPALIVGYVLTPGVIAVLKQKRFPAATLKAMQSLIEAPYTSAEDLVNAVEAITEQSLTVLQVKQLSEASRRDTIGPSVTNGERN
jgi:hypothetical protein